MYTAVQVDELHERARELYAQCFELQEKLIITAAKMPDKAKEHAIYGVARRLGTLRESMRFFFDHLPPDLNEEAEIAQLAQGNANLHAFLINCSGIIDNLAWLLAYHLFLDEEMDLEKNKFDIGLFNKKFRKYLPGGVAAKVDEFDDWHGHIIGNRHPTAHRIPPYVIPYIQSATTGENDYTPRYIHAFDKSHPVPLHPQFICDLGAVVELVEALYADIAGTYA